jgi:hypothetical protein
MPAGQEPTPATGDQEKIDDCAAPLSRLTIIRRAFAVSARSDTMSVHRRSPMRRSLLSGIVLTVLLAACHPTKGCPESQFTLASESRLPVWFSLPEGLQRGDVEVILEYYSPLSGTEAAATLTLRSRQGGTLAQVEATQRGTHPLTVGPYPETGPLPYPRYQVLTANGKSDLIEHRRMEPVFYVSDDAELRSKFGVPPR